MCPECRLFFYFFGIPFQHFFLTFHFNPASSAHRHLSRPSSPRPHHRPLPPLLLPSLLFYYIILYFIRIKNKNNTRGGRRAEGGGGVPVCRVCRVCRDAGTKIDLENGRRKRKNGPKQAACWAPRHLRTHTHTHTHTQAQLSWGEHRDNGSTSVLEVRYQKDFFMQRRFN